MVVRGRLDTTPPPPPEIPQIIQNYWKEDPFGNYNILYKMQNICSIQNEQNSVQWNTG